MNSSKEIRRSLLTSVSPMMPCTKNCWVSKSREAPSGLKVSLPHVIGPDVSILLENNLLQQVCFVRLWERPPTIGRR
jgi:hypothetical protein